MHYTKPEAATILSKTKKNSHVSPPQPHHLERNSNAANLCHPLTIPSPANTTPMHYTRPDAATILSKTKKNSHVSPPQPHHLERNSNAANRCRPLTIPSPANTTTMHYTRPEAATILSKTKRGTGARGRMTNAMVTFGYAPTSARSLQRMMREKDAGNLILDSPWPSASRVVASFDGDSCQGIQSKALDDKAVDHLKYCYEKGWYTMSSYRQWHAKGCIDQGMDKYGRCIKCRSAFSNMNRTRHPELFETMPTYGKRKEKKRKLVVRRGLKRSTLPEVGEGVPNVNPSDFPPVLASTNKVIDRDWLLV